MLEHPDPRHKVMYVLILCAAMAGAARAADVIHIASDEQLFLDEDRLIEKLDNITQRVNQARKHGPPVLRPDKPWEEATALLYGSVIFDEEEHMFKMWYYAGRAGVAYATSSDGIHWDKPELDLYPYEGQKTNLIAKLSQWDYFREIIGVHKDNREPNPNRRYKMTFVSMHYDYKGPHPNRYKPHKRIGLAKVKRGRLISLEAGFDSGYVRTRPFYFEGSKLFFNANARYGLITIRFYDEEGKRYRKFWNTIEVIAINEVNRRKNLEDKKDLNKTLDDILND